MNLNLMNIYKKLPKFNILMIKNRLNQKDYNKYKISLIILIL